MKTLLLTRKNTKENYRDAYEISKLFPDCTVTEVTDKFRDDYCEIRGTIQIPIGTTVYVYSQISAS